ncbi:MAG: helicase-related protein [Candidatus Velthaea sp.]
MYSREDGNLAGLVLRPALARSLRYDRSAGYFSAQTLVIASDSIENLVSNDGTMRLVVGSLMSLQEAEAIERGERTAAEIAETKCVASLAVPSGIAHDALELLGWLVAQNRLRIRFALPRRVEDGLLDLDHIFHQKTAIFTDDRGDRIGFNGSVNETPAGWGYNWESLTLFRSWDALRPALDELADNFEKLWTNRMRTAYVVDIPTAMKEQLLRYAPPDGELPARLREPLPRLSYGLEAQSTFGWREVRAYLSDTPVLSTAIAIAARTSAVEPWRHQWQAFRRMFEPWRDHGRYPRLLIADEVGLGKTIEAGLLLRQAVMSGLARRVLVMVPAGVQRQWQRELREKFALDWPIYDGHDFVYGAKAIGGDDRRRLPRGLWTNQPFVITSSHLLRRLDRQEAVIEASPWDILIVDEVHHARREAAGTANEGSPNRLLALLQRLAASGRLRGVILLSATPMQTALVEIFDLLAMLGLPEAWRDRTTFEGFFTRLRKPVLSTDDIARLAALIGAGARELPDGEKLIQHAIASIQLSPIERRKIENVMRTGALGDASALKDEQRETFREIARRATPLAALVSRHTRPLLRQYGIKIARREPVDLFVERSVDEDTIYKAVEAFIQTEFKRAEQILDRRRRSAIGFVLAIYGKRLASSLVALQKTLRRHANRVEERFAHDILEDVEFDDDDGVARTFEPPDDEREARTLEAEGAAQIEMERIASILRMIDDFHARSVDAKLDVLRGALHELEEAGYDQAIVFTQYTDTLDWLREHLQGMSILCYSGRGGEYRAADGSWQHLSRDDTKKRFIHKEAQLLLCTDAAAEGLNLQTCGALVNYDLPWNPMRVEQRIGRIDRIGQPRDVVRIVNLYYPGTVETVVYQRLRERIGLFGDVVGKLQPILAQAATIIERATFREGVTPHGALLDLDGEIDELDRSAFDLDASVLADLADADRVPEPPYDLAQLSLLLDRPDALPPGYDTQALGASQWAVRAEPGGVQMRVTSDREIYEQNLEDYELWTPGSRVFPAIDPPREDVLVENYQSSLRELLNPALD